MFFFILRFIASFRYAQYLFNEIILMQLDKYKVSLILQCLVFLVPLNIYVIGDWLGSGVQWALFRYQQTYMGTSLILVTRDATFVLTNIISGRSAVSLILWAAGVFLFIVALILVILANTGQDYSLIKKASVITIAGGIIITISILVQYGILLSSMAGFAIPVGVPIVLIIGWWMYQDNFEPTDTDNEPLDDESGPE